MLLKIHSQPLLMLKTIIGELQLNQKFKQPFMISDDDFELGAVDYTPFSTALNTTAPISPPSNVTKSVSGSDVVLNWSANGESDIAGYKLHFGSPTGYSYSTTVDLGNVTTYTVLVVI